MYKTYRIITYGCQMNKSDSERIEAIMRSAKFQPAQESKTDLLIINACAVRQSAVNRIWGQIEKNTGGKKPLIIISGCVLPDDKKKLKQKNILFLDINELPHWPAIIRGKSAMINKGRKKEKKPDPRYTYLNAPVKHQSSFSAYIPIMTGCDNFCAYCAVPYTRGKEYSRPPIDIINEVYKLIIQGYKEIILLGQNVNSYQGEKPKNKFTIPGTNQKLIANKLALINFPALLKAINAIPGEFWIRFTTAHPKDLSDELIATMAAADKICPQINLPAQSGDNNILKKMNRRYTIEHYKKLIQKLRAALPNIAISTDIIVGFPSENKKQFANTARLLREINYDMAYIAEYSPRPNTAAFKLKDNILKTEKQRRRQILTDILKKTALKNNQRYVGKKQKILVQSLDSKKNLWGETSTGKKVKLLNTLPDQKNIIGQWAMASITKAGPWSLAGILLKKNKKTKKSIFNGQKSQSISTAA